VWYTPIKYTPMRCTLMRYTPIRYRPIRHTPIRCTPVIYEFPLRAGHGWRESLYRYQGCLKLLIVGDSAVRLLVTLGARSVW
jgi:hypothetical protein